MKLCGSTRILGIFGDPVAHSLSPVMQNAALQEAGIDAVYVPFHVQAPVLAEAVQAIRSLGIWGVNVTVPHKEAVIPCLDEVDVTARLIGAVNTIVNRNGRLVGYNTDSSGFIRSLADDLHFEPRDKKILLLGAGGACRAALVALCRAGAAEIRIANRTRSRAEGLVKEFTEIFGETRLGHFALDTGELESAASDVDLVVNTSAVGLKGERFSEMPWNAMASGAVVYDMVYSLHGTPLVREALEKGLRAVGGQGMLICQGEEAFLIWTGCRSPEGAMRAAIDRK